MPLTLKLPLRSYLLIKKLKEQPRLKLEPSSPNLGLLPPRPNTTLHKPRKPLKLELAQPTMLTPLNAKILLESKIYKKPNLLLPRPPLLSNLHILTPPHSQKAMMPLLLSLFCASPLSSALLEDSSGTGGVRNNLKRSKKMLKELLMIQILHQNKELKLKLCSLPSISNRKEIKIQKQETWKEWMPKPPVSISTALMLMIDSPPWLMLNTEQIESSSPAA
jgi:hypothetical protein